SFLNLSTEYWSVPHYADQRRLFARAIDLLRLPGDPFTLRIGGESGDLSWWNPRPRRVPQWAYPLTPSWLTGLVRLTAQAHLHLILDLNMADRNPVREAAFAKAVITRLPPGTVQGLEIGNEPDLYPRMNTLGLYTATHAKVVKYFAWADRYGPDRYVSQFGAYAAALARAGVHLPLGGPELSNPTLTQWLPGLIAAEPGRLAVVTAHRYPLNACTVPSEPLYPTIPRLLADQATAGLAASVRPAVLIAHQAGLQFSLDEFNSVTCGGTPTVSGTFANALWAPDALFSLMQVGVSSVDLHIRARAYNPPFFVTPHGLRTRPIFYGLIMFQRMLGRDSWLVPTALEAPAHTLLRAWVVRAGGMERVLLINKGKRSANIRLALGAAGTGIVQRLVGVGGPTARTRVTLAGQWLTPGGRWRGRFTEETVRPTAGRYEVPVPAYSAALVTLRLAPAHG
ncbi:MAG TPA: glycosyl hydrolase family 79 C-terminal domain-containing protein, partial [Streptosporangiaceae bacterium]|nr:glycosyl hydrolase family 79 C-terminal domain-containing protein [Streptosporangiaceae bacterium]